MNIIEYIPTGKDNAISRADLRRLTGLGDRAIRDMIADARRETVILNLQDGGGYFIPEKDEAHLIRQYIMQEEHRLRSIGYALKSARKAIKN